MSKPRKEDRLLTRKEAADYIGLENAGTLAVWHSTKRYKLPLIKVGSRVRYRKSDLDKFLECRLIS